jgi:hypothetical protein
LDSNTYYDGTGHETKRQANKLDDEGVWEPQSVKYYVRSSVLLGRVVSEVWANGRKHRSFVKGIGNETAVQSAFPSDTAALSETVVFEFSDASGMSYRTRDSLGNPAATGDGGEGAPIETDPLGGNVGTHTPYITFSGGYHTSYPDLQVYNTYDYDLANPDFSSLYATFGSRIADLPGFGTNWGSFADFGMAQYEERVENSRLGFGFVTNDEFIARETAAARTAATASSEMLNGGSAEGGYDSTSTLVAENLGGLLDSSVTVSAGGFGINNLFSSASSLQQKPAQLPNRDTVNKCLSTLASRYKKGGKISYTGINYDSTDHSFVFSFDLNGASYSVYVNATDYDSSQLGEMWESDNNQPHRGRKEAGYLSYASQLGNRVRGHVASDVLTRVGTDFTEIGRTALFYHESGNGVAVAVINSLTDAERGKIRGFWHSSIPTKQGDDDPGTGFERCLFGGIVSLRSGNVGNSRDF